MPSLKMGYANQVPDEKRHARLRKRKRLEDADLEDTVENDGNAETGVASQTCVLLVDAACQTDNTMEDLMKMEEELKQLRQEYQDLKNENAQKTDASFTVDVLKTDEQRLKFYTG